MNISCTSFDAHDVIDIDVDIGVFRLIHLRHESYIYQICWLTGRWMLENSRVFDSQGNVIESN